MKNRENDRKWLMYSLTLSNITIFRSFLFDEKLIYYQKIKLIFKRRDGSMSSQKEEMVECAYCSGKGYFQLVLGGSETCNSCQGSGKK